MEIKIITDKTEWNDPSLPFTQSWEWGEILISERKEVERLAVTDDGGTLARAQVIYHDLPFGWEYAFCPKGPSLNGQKPMAHDQTSKMLADYLKNKKCIFLRFEPEESAPPPVPGYECRQAEDVNPRATLILDLSRSEDGLFAQMHPKTRYNIHLAEKKDIIVKEEKDSALFYALMKETSARDGFRPHPFEHYRVIISFPISRQLTAFSGQHPVASAVFVGTGETFTYLFGASDYEARPFMAPHLLQWEGIKLGKRLGYKYYDFFGVAPRRGAGVDYDYDPTHRYAGVTRFKLGFVPTQGRDPASRRETAGTFDVVLDKNRYWMYQFMKKAIRFLKSA